MDLQQTLQSLCCQIIRLAAPQRIILYNQKQSPAGDLSSVKLCVIVPEGDSRQWEHDLYMQLETDLPFDLLVYTRQEWRQLLAADLSFAARIDKTGRVLYAADETYG